MGRHADEVGRGNGPGRQVLMVLGKEEIWDRLQTDSRWITGGPAAPTDIFAANVAERQFRYIIALWIPGDLVSTVRLEIFKKDEDGDYHTKWCPIPVAPADFRQIPEGSYSIVDPIITLEGGTNMAGSVDLAGHSLNVTVVYWDWDI